FKLLVTATDGATAGADIRAGTLTMASSLDFGAEGCGNQLPCGGSCDDGDACTVDTCGENGCEHAAISCAGGDACHMAGTCNPATGACENAPKPDGTSCDDGNACTTTDACQAGVCTPGAPV